MDESENSTQKNPKESKKAIRLPEPNKTTISWTASDSIDHEHTKKWYFGLFLTAIILCGLLAILTFFNIITLFMAISTGVLVVLILITILVSAKNPSHEITYQLNNNELKIDQKKYPFSDFRAFGVYQINASMWQLVLIPKKRFGLSLTAFFHKEQGEQIVDLLGSRLPMEKINIDLFDKLASKLKI